MKAVHIKCNVVQIFNFHGTRHIIKSVRRLVLCIWRRLSAQRFITKIYIRFLTFRLKRQSTANVFVQLRIIEAEGPTIMGFFSRNQNLENISHMKCWKIFRIQDIYFAIGLLYTQLKHLHAAFSAYLLFRNTERLLFFFIHQTNGSIHRCILKKHIRTVLCFVMVMCWLNLLASYRVTSLKARLHQVVHLRQC